MASPEDFSLKEINPNIQGANAPPGHDLTMVEHMQYLYIKLWSESYNRLGDVSSIQVTIGNYQCMYDMSKMREGDEVFAFSKEHLQSKTVEILVKNMMNKTIGQFPMVISDVPTLHPGDPELVPKWYSLEDENGVVNGEVMLSAWMGNQGDEAFSKAWNSDAASVSANHLLYSRACTYKLPKLSYLRVKVLEAQDLVPVDKRSEFFVKATLGNETLRTQASASKTRNPKWSEELIFVAEETSQEKLILTVEQLLTVEEKDTTLALQKFPEPSVALGVWEMPLNKIDKVLSPPPVSEKWVNLKRHAKGGEEKNMQTIFASKIRVIVYLDGMYHVFTEPAGFSSDLTTTSPRLKGKEIGLLEVGILKAEHLAPMKERNGINTTDAFCLAKYGQKWLRTRTIVGNLAPKWNEECRWAVYEPSTVLVVGVFDNQDLWAKDPQQPYLGNAMIGKVRIRLSTLETGRIYAHAYPIVRVVGPKGVKKMGELHLVIRFTCTSMTDLLYNYTQPLLSKPSYANPLSVYQIQTLREQAVSRYCSWFRQRSGSPLPRDVVAHMLDSEPPAWSIRIANANFNRVLECLSFFTTLWGWFDDVRQWENTTVSLSFWFLFLYWVWFQPSILPYLFSWLFVMGIRNYWKRPTHPPCLDATLSCLGVATANDFDEELDTFPSSAPYEVLRRRYDRLRRIGGRISTTLGEFANQLERVLCVLSWREPRVTFLFMVFCVLATVVTYIVPSRWLLFATAIYLTRPPRLRVTLPSIPQNLIRRLPAKEDSMIYY
ncbi:hypothetical protein Tsubulata_921621 [Turnera subulata]|uniref:C2 domain-containing protein n=1 Tax=Turnera subulata TaxID=218843 RepID=A0A9Q0FVU6_9ROSI|nr:hypothetical protein Tsubulata_921621 [Turnera subulata]